MQLVAQLGDHENIFISNDAGHVEIPRRGPHVLLYGHEGAHRCGMGGDIARCARDEREHHHHMVMHAHAFR